MKKKIVRKFHVSVVDSSCELRGPGALDFLRLSALGSRQVCLSRECGSPLRTTRSHASPTGWVRVLAGLSTASAPEHQTTLCNYHGKESMVWRLRGSNTRPFAGLRCCIRATHTSPKSHKANALPIELSPRSRAKVVRNMARAEVHL